MDGELSVIARYSLVSPVGETGAWSDGQLGIIRLKGAEVELDALMKVFHTLSFLQAPSWHLSVTYITSEG